MRSFLILLLSTICAVNTAIQSCSAAPPEVCADEIIPQNTVRVEDSHRARPEAITPPAPEASNDREHELPAPESRSSSASQDHKINDLKALVRQLSERRGQLRDEMRAARAHAPLDNEAKPGSPSFLKQMEEDLANAARQRDKRLHDVRREICRLRHMLARKHQRQAEPNPRPMPSPRPGPEPPAVPPKPPTRQFPAFQSDDLAPPPTDPATTEPVAVPITDEPVDRIGLADNLYATGEFQLAIEVYVGLAATNLPEEKKLWIEHQIASCHRKLGNDVEAETHYRRIAGDDNAGFLAENARWWLSVMRQRREANSKHDQIKAVIETIGDNTSE
jgi:hypothetical protein